MAKQKQLASKDVQFQGASGGAGFVANPRGERGASRSSVSADERHRMIAEAAYYIAQQRGFQGDLSLDDWLRAEADVDASLAGEG